MKTENEFPETLQETIVFFADEQRAFEFVRSIRWENGEATCPRCDSKESYFLASRRMWKCKGCSHKYGVRFGTIFQDSPLPLGKWMTAFWLLTNAKNGISSYEIHRALGVTQKTGWFMLGRIRLAIQNGSIVKMTGTIEADETYVGGRAEFMHKNVKRRRGITQGNGWYAKTAVVGLLQRPTEAQPVSKVFAAVLPKVPTKRAAMPYMHANVEQGAEVHTDASKIYEDVQRDFIHKVVDHAKTYVQGNVHTNGLENFWALLKRAIKGTYISVEPFHLHRYVVEQVFRFNARKDEDGDAGVSHGGRSRPMARARSRLRSIR